MESNMLIQSFILIVLTWSTLTNCENFKSIYINDQRTSSIIYGTFNSTELSKLTESIVDCKYVKHPKIMNEVLSSAGEEVKSLIVTINDVDTFDLLATRCDSINLTTTASTSTSTSTSTISPSLLGSLVKPRAFKIFGISSDLLIAPGTKWCGPGNRSTGYDDLGEAIETDKCCRDHDYCPVYIDAGDTRYNLTNDTPYTASHCDCDEQLKSCLKEASKKDVGASLFGIIYFNIIRFQCFREVIPKGECLEYSGVPYSGRCIRYADSISTEPVYAFQDSGMFT